MGLRLFLFALLVIHGALGQNAIFRVCMPESQRNTCLSLERIGGEAVCDIVESRIDCAMKLARGEVDIGVFSEEETLLLALHAPNDGRVIATIRDIARDEPFAFQAVAVVPVAYTGGLAGVRGAKFCHPGFDSADQRWSPRVLKEFERAVANSDRCPGGNAPDKSADELEVEVLNEFFSAACRPGPWSANTTVDEDLKRRFPNLCSLCGNNNTCTGYNINMGVSVAGVSDSNRHIQALECMRSNGEGSVSYVAWQHVREFFQLKRPDEIGLYGLLCPNGETTPLSAEVLASASSPCAYVSQPWSTIVTSTGIYGLLCLNGETTPLSPEVLASASSPCDHVSQPWSTIVTSTQAAASTLSAMTGWWPQGTTPASGTWQATLFSGLIGGANARVIFETEPRSPVEYTASIRTIPAIDATTGCVPARRWCTTSAQEQIKCNWLRSAAHVLGIQPSITCATRDNVFQCLRDIRDNQLDLYVSSSNYGYLARQHYQLSPVKLVQTARSDATRVVALVKESSATTNITRFESLRGSKACFPEFSGIAYMAFVKAAQDRGVISAQECDYARAVGEFFDGACAGGAVDASHALSEKSDFNTTTLCTVCRPASWANTNTSAFTCAWDHSNMYFGNNGTLACLNDPTTQFAVLQTHKIDEHLANLSIAATSFRALCRNNTLALNPGVTVDDACLLAYVTDAEIITRRTDPNLNALNVLLDTLEAHFGYSAENGAQHINLEMYSPLDNIPDLLFKDTAIGLVEPSQAASTELTRNYVELFQHLEACTGSAPGLAPGDATRHLLSALTLAFMTIMTKFVIN